ncbi:group II intron reverse transcriptase/maturase [Desulfopila sp. IMCC35006]|uniref:group II intron reverse transcriptase/maturase n=1 Tax=Desulfopila sp. IMCC35006 TaxID=2569542 RepID=UPI00142F0E9E|nr:group II intron reverse transcriptase/maturase [Desulfopila sp. IMCC35006]
MQEAKPFQISKLQVWEAFKKVKANRGAAGVDGQSLAEFEEDLKRNLYKLWNRLSSGSYFPSPVRRVEIPKSDGRVRPLGIPTVADRIAQMVVKHTLEPLLEPHFHHDSYGYRPGKSALDAVGVARQRCWKRAWVLDLDIKGFFDNIDHKLMLKAVQHHTDCRWILLYVERWLKCPVQYPDGTIKASNLGTPQGGVISPLLANLFLHYAFDVWMRKNFPEVQFERYADDVVCHCVSESEAKRLRVAIESRLGECQLELHPEKTKIVFCKEQSRQGHYPVYSFDFLGFTFRPRLAKNKYGKFFVGFLPAISNKAAKSIKDEMRKWRIHRRSDKSLEDLSRVINPKIRGWVNYYAKFFKSGMFRISQVLNRMITKWAMRKLKKIKGQQRKATHWLGRVAERKPHLFAHWQILKMLPAAGQ